MNIKQVQEVITGHAPCIYGEYRGFNNQRRLKHNTKTDVMEEKATITHFIETRTPQGIYSFQVQEFHEKYNKEYKSPLLMGKTYLFELSYYENKRSVGWLAFNSHPVEILS